MTDPAGPRFVAYYRVSTDKQGRSGLGLEAQRQAVSRHAAGCGGSVVAAFEGVESGRKGDRPQLALAMAECRLRRCTLLIAKRFCQPSRQGHAGWQAGAGADKLLTG